MTFEKWLLKQKHRADPVGDLARDFISAKKYGDKKCNAETLSKWDATSGAFTALEVAQAEYHVNAMATYFLNETISKGAD